MQYVKIGSRRFPKIMDRPNEPDEQRQGGGFYSGWRRVRSDGSVKADSTYYKEHAEPFYLLKFVGCWVRVTINTYWGQEASVGIRGETITVVHLE